MSFKKAVRRQQKLRLGIDGPSGCGKTMSSLKIARGIVGPKGRICVIDTENESSALFAVPEGKEEDQAKYPDLFAFDVEYLRPPFSPKRYVSLIKEAEEIADILIIDSGSHEWIGTGGCLEMHSKIPGNSFAAWRVITPLHNSFTDAILESKCHIIVTFRSKQSYAQEQDENNKLKVKKLGLSPQQRDGIEYELTAVLSMDITHVAHSSKDRTRLFPENHWFQPEISTGEMLRDWLSSGSDPLPSPAKERQLTMTEVTDKWNGEILDDDIVMINGEKIKPPVAQIKKLREHDKHKKQA